MPRNTASPNTRKGRNGGAGGGSQQQQSPAASSPASHQSHSQSPEDSVTTEAILAKLTKAKSIETSLETAESERKAHPKRKPSPTSDEKSQALRLQLCGILSDVILLDCTLADANDAIGRLWKICFYGRINDIRNRIVREKSRAKKRTAAGSVGEATACKRAVENLERQLKKFLGEAVQLYKYLIERYAKELMPLSQTQGSAGSDDYLSQEEERGHIVVSSLFKMHIHLGDLYRYSASNKLAEECYLVSARLAPGTGNPFNQLAVVAQQSQDNMTAAALYYYARSLMASRSPFETSRSNLVRLFEGNRKWLEEHARDDSAHTRGIVDIVGNTNNQKGKGGGGKDKKGQKEWMQKERAALNRKALARFVDLQWAFFRGVSLGGEADDGKIDLDGLVKKMKASMATFGDLISHASFGEGLLCKLVAVLAFSSFGASNNGKLMNATEGFDARRAKDPSWNEGIVMTNQALAFGYFLRFCAVLANDVDAVIAKKAAAANSSNFKLGAIRSFSPLLLGFRFATSMYEGSQWFHGLPFFPTDDVSGMESSSTVHKLCKESHTEFWKAIATLATRFDGLPNTKKHNGGQELYDLTDVKDFDEYHGFVPFASFMDKSDEKIVTSEKHKKTKYASTDEAMSALADTKSSNGRGGGEAETRLKIDLFLSIADGKTKSTEADDMDGQCFLTKNKETSQREIITSGATEEEEKDAPSHVESPTITGMEVEEVPAGIEEVHVLIQSGEQVPPKEPAQFLLTPSALLSGAGGNAEKQPTANSEQPRKSSPVAPVDSILAPSVSTTEPPSNMGALASNAVDSILNSALQAKQPEPAAKAALPPPPGFSMPPPQQTIASQFTHAAPPLAPTTMTGISLADLTTTAPVAQSNVAPLGANQAFMMPQAGPGYPASSSILFETLNPFAQQQATIQPAPFNNNFLASSTSTPNLNQQPHGLLNIQPHGSNANLQQPPPPNSKGLDPTLDFLLSNNLFQTTTPAEQHAASSNALNFLVPSPAAEPVENDPAESIMNFLFDSGHGDSSQNGGHVPLYAAGQHGHPTQATGGMPHTHNPFAT